MDQKIDVALFKNALDTAKRTCFLFENKDYKKAVESFVHIAGAVDPISKTGIFVSKYATDFNHWLGLMVSFAGSNKMQGAYDVIAQKIMPMLSDMLMDAIILRGIKEFTDVDDMDELTKKVQDQYKEFMYPNKWKGIVPQDYKEKYQDAVISPWYNLNHIQNMSRSKPKPTSDLSVLIAGCGTGEDALGCAWQFGDADFTFVDISPSSLAMAKYYGGQMGIHNVEYRLENIMTMDLEKTFDIIISVGVIHHLSEPHTGIETLKRHLKDDGAMAIMVYGEYGRFEIGLFQEALKLMNKERDTFDFGIQAVPQMLRQLSDRSRLHDLMWKNDIYKGEQHIVDLLLNVNENKYNVKSLSSMMAKGGMRITEFPWFRLYDPLSYSDTPLIRESAGRLGFIDKAYLGELLHGRVTKHTIYAVKQENAFDVMTTSNPNWMDMIPVKSEYLVADERVTGVKEKKYYVSFSKLLDLDVEFIDSVEISLDAVAWKLLSACDGKRTVKQISNAVLGTGQQPNAALFQKMIDNRLLHLHKK